MRMIAEIVSIGDELISGHRLDTNGRWLSQRLGELGISVQYHTTTGDDHNRIVAVLRHATFRADLVVVTGGLGPTADDLTRQALSDACQAPLVACPEALQAIRERFHRRGQSMPPRNEVQALHPRGSHMIPNPHGTAPGIWMQVARPGKLPSYVAALPGVPSEIHAMWADSVRHRIAAIAPGRRLFRHRRIKCFGVGESQLQQMLPDLIRRGRQPTVGITASQATITLRITSAGADEQACLDAMQSTVSTIYASLGSFVFGEEDDELEDAVARLLDAQAATLTTAEVGTGGLVGERLHSTTAVGRLRGSVVASDMSRLATLLHLEASPAVAADPAGFLRSAAEMCRQAHRADFALVTGLLPEVPAGGGSEASVIVVACPSGHRLEKIAPTGDPALQRIRAAKQALDALRRQLLQAR